MEIIFGIFAHPDDETLVAGTLKQMQAKGAEVNLILITDGQAGTNPHGDNNLGETRLQEWQQSTAIIGARRADALHYSDGQLASDNIQQIVENVCDLVLKRLSLPSEQTSLSFMTFDEDGLTGHSDHIITTQVVRDVSERLKSLLPLNSRVKELLLLRLTTAQAAAGPGTTEYPLTGYTEKEIDRINNVAEFISKKKAAMKAHVSQTSDMTAWMDMGDTLLSVEGFRVIEIR